MTSEVHVEVEVIDKPVLSVQLETPPPVTTVMHVGGRGLKGEKGDKGDKGDQGIQGEQGDPGADSIVPGPQGEPGEQGEPGADSTVPGPQGDPGEVEIVTLTQAEYDALPAPDPDTLYVISDGPGSIEGSHATTTQVGTVRTTTAAQTTIVTCPIPASTIVMIEARVVARRTGGVSGAAEDGAAYIKTFAWKNIADVATAIGAPGNVAVMESQGAWDVVSVANGSNVDVKVVGAANNIVDWKAIVQTYEVSVVV